MVKVLLAAYIIYAVIYVICNVQPVIVLAFGLAIGMFLVAEILLRLCQSLFKTDGDKQIVYLFFFSAGMQYFLQGIMWQVQGRDVMYFELFHIVPLLFTIVIFYRYALMPAAAVIPVLPPPVAPFKPIPKKEPIHYYEILNESAISLASC